jgi:transposase
MNVTTIGIDLAKHSFSLHGVDAQGNVVFRKTLSRGKLLPFLAQQPPCLVGMEACSGAHAWARELVQLGHRVGIMAPRFVAPYRKGGKNDGNDAEAICEAVGRPGMRFVPVKSAEQQAILCLHRVRAGLIKERTALTNRLRGLLTEFGLIMPKGRYSAQLHIPDLLEDADNGLPMLARRLLHDTYLRLQALHQQVLAYDRELNQLARTSASAQRLMTVPGIGAITATAILASVGDPRQFRNGRQFAAWLGLTPRQYTTGGKIRLGRITKRGDAYLRTLLIHGTRAVLATVTDKDDRLSLWVQALIARRGYKRATVALAAKNARILWAMMVRSETYQLKTA